MRYEDFPEFARALVDHLHQAEKHEEQTENPGHPSNIEWPINPGCEIGMCNFLFL